MPKLILKCPYTKGGTVSAAAHLENLVNYVATRNGVDKVSESKSLLPPTKRQQAAVQKVLRAFPESKNSHAYEDYLAAPTRGSASEFISQAVEENLDQIAKLENYVDYIAMRPHAERQGAHGLFSQTDEPITLDAVAKEISTHPGNIWKPIISLRREDAARLGYDSGKAWQDLLRSVAPQMADALKIPFENFRWYAAFHDETHHPHVHMLCYSTDPKEGYLTVQGIEKMKSLIVGRIFRQEQLHVYEKQTARRDELTQDSREIYKRLCNDLSAGALHNSKVEELILALAEKLRNTSGKKVYGYLKPEAKALVDEIVDELANDPRAEEAYRMWYELREKVLHTYTDKMLPRLPLSQQKEFKRIKNIVIEETLRRNQNPDDSMEVELPEAIPLPDGLPVPEQEIPDSTWDSLILESEPELPEGTSPREVMEDDSQNVQDASWIDEPQDPAAEAEPAQPHMEWSDRYREAKQFLYGTDDVPQDFEKAFRLFMEEAQSGNALAMHDLGRMYADGLGCTANLTESGTWYAKALEIFQIIESEKPNRYVEYRIGKFYASGLGTEQDNCEAAEWFTQSASQNYKYAQYSLAGLYKSGKGVELDAVKAFQLYEKAAIQKFPYASYELGKMLRDGIGTAKDEERAAQSFQDAFQGFQELEKSSHDDRLQYRLGEMLLHGVGTEKDEKLAMQYFEKASKLGNPHAQYQLAKMVLSDPNADADKKAEAIGWLTASADQGNQFAQYALGKLYLAGEDVPKNVDTALQMLTASADQGNQFAQYALGKLYLKGEDVPKDVEVALQMLTASADQGNQFAQYALGKLYLVGEDAPKDTEAAIRLLTASADQGNQFARYTLGKLYLLGKDVPQDREAALYWFKLSAAQGNEYAQYFLDHWVEPIAVTVTRLLRHLGNIFREQAPAPIVHAKVDSKLRRKLAEKKQALGHATNDHELY